MTAILLSILFSILILAAVWAVVLYLTLPPVLAIAVTAAVALAWVGFAAIHLLKILKARRSQEEIDRALKAQGEAQARSARPDQRGEVAEIRAELDKALQAIKSSKAARGGRNALAVLPWYMIIGPPGGGKSTALLASELKFPYLSSKRGGVRGVGGTRNCEWWLTNKAVLLDTAGRYMGGEEDHDEWLSFLDLLARTRPRRPLNGLILALPITDVAAESEEGAAELGRQMRQRIDEVLSRLHMVLPVYVMLTKCDLLPGFVETFRTLLKNERGQIWGVTLPIAELHDSEALFAERLDELLAAVEERCYARLTDELQLASRERIFEFPQQLEACKKTLVSFVEGLCEENVYQKDSPILRGVYLTSGTHEGRVIDRVMAHMVEAFGIRSMTPVVEEKPEAKSYFLRDVFLRVIFPDQNIAFQGRVRQRRDLVRRWAAAGLAAAAAAIAFGLLVQSFTSNRELVMSSSDLVQRVAESVNAAGARRAPLTVLEPLRQRYLLLQEYARDGAPWSMRLGLYRGAILLPDVRRLYGESTRRLLIDREFEKDVDDLESFVKRFEASGASPTRTEYGRFYDVLKLHLLLTQPRGPSEPLGKGEQAWVGRAIASRWSSRSLSDPTPSEVVESNAAAYAQLLAEDPSLALPRHQELVRRSRRVLARLPQSVLALQKLAADFDGKDYDVTLASILDAPVPALRSDTKVQGAFTRRAYEEVVKSLLANPASLVETWVVAIDGAAGPARAAEADQLRWQYFREYVEQWRRFIESIQVGTGLQTLPVLQDLTHGTPAPHALIFRAVGYNTRIGDSKKGEGSRQKLEGIKRRVGDKLGSLVKKPGEHEEVQFEAADVQKFFAPFVAFGSAPEVEAQGVGGGGAPAKLPVDLYLEQLSFVREALLTKDTGGNPKEMCGRISQARVRVQTLIEDQQVGWRPVFQNLLLPPIEAALEDCGDDTAREWCSAVVTPFRQGLEGRYPFASEGKDDAGLTDVTGFFKPTTGTLWSFYEKMLRSVVRPNGCGFEMIPQQGGNRFRPELMQFLTRAQAITKALYPAGATDPRVQFSIQVIPTPGVDRVTISLNGQEYVYINGPPEWHSFTWPGDANMARASLRAHTFDGSEHTLEGKGDWGLFRLIEAGSLQSGSSSDFAVAFRFASLGKTITIQFQTDRAKSPCVGGSYAKLFQPLRGASIPVEIGRKGGACKYAADMVQ
jgi:type VI secretion system protein ImpL